MIDERWYINKVGLLNFWYYDEEEFKFSNGKLLLRGSNGSGKSVTMQSFIPLLLDGNKSPVRLDPFGSRARRLENYLLDEEDRDRDERTAYLYMEFKKKSSSKYLTIGMGFKAQRGKTMKSWGFSITDGRRIGKDILLYKDLGNKIPLTKKELENRIGDGGIVKEGQKEYMNMVNDLLFGFNEIEEYDEMIKLLIQLRTPKLSKDFKPSVVYEIMENSLQQLSEDDLRPMSEAIENMDNIKLRLEELKGSKKAAESIKLVYDKYNRIILYNKALNYIESYKEYKNLIEKRNNLGNEKTVLAEDTKGSREKLEELKLEQKLVNEKKKQLDEHDSIKIKEDIFNLERIIEDTTIEINKKENQLSDKKLQEREIYGKIKKFRDRIDREIKNIKEILEEMDILSEEFAFDEQEFMKNELQKEFHKSYDFSYISEQIKIKIEKLNKAKDGIIERDSCNRTYDNIIQEISKIKEEERLKLRNLEESELLLSETKEELIENIYNWKNQNIELILDKDKLIEVSREIQMFTEKDSYDDIRRIVREILENKEMNLNREVASLDSYINQINKEREDIEEQIDKLKNRKEIEPVRLDKVIKHREKLSKNNIPYLPFYQAFDFRDNLSIETKGRIEEALIDMGLLDAIIIPEEYKENALLMDDDMGDKYIFPSPNLLTHNLDQFLKVEKTEVEGISNVDIDNVLKSILIDDNSNVFLNEQGEYGIGIIKGKTSMEYIPKYIGVTARERHKKEQIQALNSQLENIKIEINKERENREVLIKRLERLKLEFKSYPDDKDLRTAISNLKDSNYNLDRIRDRLKVKESEEEVLYSELKELRQKVHNLVKDLNLKPDIEIYENALESAREFQSILYRLINANESVVNNSQNMINTEEQKENIEEDIENISGDLYILEKRNTESKMSKIGLEDQLNLTDYKAIENEINQCLRLIQELPVLIEEEIQRNTKAQGNLELTIERLEDINKAISIKKDKLNYKEDIFVKEFDLNLCNLKDLEDINKNANMVVKETRPKGKREGQTNINELYQKFNENNQYLREYILRIDDGSLDNIDDPSEGRLFIKGKVRGKEIEFHELLRFIYEGIDENERLLKESDRQLFEDILVNNISKKIRAKIYNSQSWVDRMNKLMEGMNTSNGLSFSLNWANKKAESEGQLDTRELVGLLRQEGSLMKETDLNKLSEHFRSKISEARRIQEDEGRNQSFHRIMSEVLDYRKWFEFKLGYRKTGDNKKELTNNAFYKLSGGEKAMAMYVPLFAAVYSRFNGARTDAPRLISLDEAFAGVDEKNIRDMFRLLEELDLDYMINSQVLWGDYDTVSSLAISELRRPDNAKFIAILRYNWNGQIKELVV